MKNKQKEKSIYCAGCCWKIFYESHMCQKYRDDNGNLVDLKRDKNDVLKCWKCINNSRSEMLDNEDKELYMVHFFNKEMNDLITEFYCNCTPNKELLKKIVEKYEEYCVKLEGVDPTVYHWIIQNHK
ncbi:hypothetical protein M0R36_10760 [bacterium]|jgi:hypothetical protein|nr:hypothetical protein [bacterium]